jgi:hypothetical protein
MTPYTYAQACTPRIPGATAAQVLADLAAAGAPVAGFSPRAPQSVLINDFDARQVEESNIRADLALMVQLAVLAALDPDWCAAWMTWFAEVYIPALPAVWDVGFTSSLSPQTIQPTDVVVVQSTSGQLFQLSIASAATLAPSGTLTMTARTPGTASNVSPSSITKIVSAPVGLSLTGTPTLYTAGRDIETPQAAIQRCLGKWGTLGAGWTMTSLDYLIPLFAPTVTRWLVRTDNPNGPGTIAVILANAAGPATTAEVNAVLAGLMLPSRFCLGCGGLSVVPAAAVYVSPVATLKGDGTNPNLAANCAAAIAALGLAFPIGPARLLAGLANSIAFGAAYPNPISIPTASDDSTSTQITVPALVGFGGVDDLLVAPLTSDQTLPTGAVFVVNPAVITVQ